MKRFMYGLSLYCMCVLPYSVGVHIVQSQRGTINDWNGFFLYFNPIVLCMMLVELEDDIVYAKRNLLPQFITYPSEFRWYKLWIANLMLLQVLLGYFNERAFPGYRFVPLEGGGVYWFAYALLIASLLICASIFKKKVLNFVDVDQAVCEEDRT